MAYRKKNPNKSLDCKLCGERVDNVGAEATAVTCWRCVSRSMGGYRTDESETK